MALPRTGEIVDGYRFKGGDPGAQDSWEPVTSPLAGDVIDGYKFKGGNPNSQDSWEPLQESAQAEQPEEQGLFEKASDLYQKRLKQAKEIVGIGEYESVTKGAAQDDTPAIERRGGPLSKETFAQAKALYESAPKETRDLLIQSEGAVGNAFRNVDDQYNASDEVQPSRKTDQRIEARQQQLEAGGLTKETARNIAQQGRSLSDVGFASEGPEGADGYGLGDTDFALAVAKIAPTTGKLLIDMGRLSGEYIPFVGDVLIAGSDKASEAIAEISKRESPEMQAKAIKLQELMAGGDQQRLSVTQFLSANPDLLTQVAIPSAGSMLVAAGPGVAVRALGGSAALATDATIASSALMNAGAAFSETEGDPISRYTAAAIAAGGTLIAGKLTKGGVEGAIARGPEKFVGDATTNKIWEGIKAITGTAGREYAQEFMEGGSEALGVQTSDLLTGKRDSINLQEIANQAQVEGAAGLVLGGGVAIAQELSPQAAPPEERDRLTAEAYIEAQSKAAEIQERETNAQAALEGIANAESVDDAIKLAAAASESPMATEALDIADLITEVANGQADTAPAVDTETTGLESDLTEGSGITADVGSRGGLLSAGLPAGDAGVGTGVGFDRSLPVASAQDEAVTPEVIAGEKIDKEWTEFSEESGSIGIPRDQMPQIKAEHRGAMVNFLNARGITSEKLEMEPGELKATQAEFSPKKVEKAKEYTDNDRSILVSSDNHVLDGHHQWVAKMELGEPISVIRLNAKISELLPTVAEFPSATTSEGVGPSTTQSKLNQVEQSVPDEAGMVIAMRDSLLGLIDAKEMVNVAARLDDNHAVKNDALKSSRESLRAAEQAMRKAYGNEEATPMLNMSVNELYDLYDAVAGNAFSEGDQVRDVTADAEVLPASALPEIKPQTISQVSSSSAEVPENELRPIVESITKRRAAATQMNRLKPFERVLAAAKKLMAGETVKPGQIKIDANALKGDKDLHDLAMRVHEMAKAPAKAEKQARTASVEDYSQRIAAAKTEAEIQAIADEIAKDASLTDRQVEALDDAAMDRMDNLDRAEAPKAVAVSASDRMRERQRKLRIVDPAMDTMLVAIAKVGGFKKGMPYESDIMASLAIDGNVRVNIGGGFAWLFTKQGKSISNMAELMHQYGYIDAPEESALESSLNDFRGENHSYAYNPDYAQAIEDVSGEVTQEELEATDAWAHADAETQEAAAQIARDIEWASFIETIAVDDNILLSINKQAQNYADQFESDLGDYYAQLEREVEVATGQADTGTAGASNEDSVGSRQKQGEEGAAGQGKTETGRTDGEQAKLTSSKFEPQQKEITYRGGQWRIDVHEHWTGGLAWSAEKWNEEQGRWIKYQGNKEEKIPRSVGMQAEEFLRQVDNSRNDLLSTDANRDLLGDNTASRQAVADAERTKDAKRNTGETQDDFTLTGSDRPADQATARGAQDLFSQTQADPAAEVDKAKEVLQTAGVKGKDYLETVKDVREGKLTAGDVQEAHGPIENLGEKIGGSRKDTATALGKRGARAKADEDVPTWAKRYRISQIAASLDDSESGKWLIFDKRDKDRLGNERVVGGRNALFDSKEEAEAALPAIAVERKHKVYGIGDGKVAIYRNVSDRKRVQIVEQVFDDYDIARQYMKDNAAEILEANTTFGEIDLPTPDITERIGEARRTGDVVGDDFMEAFAFRAVEFGEWNNQIERQQVMNAAYDGLLDLAEVLKVPPKALSLNGDLALAFGARGQGLSSAKAHYERAKSVINLTKMNGAGSLAHEFFHALDHYLGRMDGKADGEWKMGEDGTRYFKAKKEPEDDYVSAGFRYQSNVRPELREVYKDLMDTIMRKATTYVEDTNQADAFVARTREQLAKSLDKLRADLSAQKDPRYWKRKNAPATAPQLAEFDTIAKQLLEGNGLEAEYRTTGEATRRTRMQPGRMSNDALEKLSDLYKAVRGRSGFDGTNRNGVLDDLRVDMSLYSQRLKMLSDAQNSTEKTKKVPTDFAMNAKELDQGRGTDYWTTPHEMAARAFQGYVEDKIAEGGGRSPFLNYGPENRGILTPWGVKFPFPRGEERKAINAAFDRFVDTLQTKETDTGVAMFSRTGTAQERVPFVAQADDGYIKTLNNVIALFKSGDQQKVREAGRTPIPISRTPVVLRQIMEDDGSKPFKRADFVVGQGSTLYLKADNIHSRSIHTGRISKEVLDKLPQLLADPVAIFKSSPASDDAKSFKVLLDAADENGDPVIVAIKPNVAMQQLNNAEVHFQATIFPTKWADIQRWNEAGDLRYYNEKSPRASRPASNPLGTVSNESENTREGFGTNLARVAASNPRESVAEASTRDWFDASIGVSASKVKVISRGDIEGMLPVAYSRVETSRRGASVKQVENLVNQFKKGWNNAPEIIVVDDMSDPRIRKAVRDENDRQLSQGAAGQPEGFFDAGKVYIVASEMRSVSDVARVVMHETLGHAGLRGLYGDELQKILKQVSVMRRSDVIAKAKQYGLDATKESDRLIAAEEVLAEMAQTNPQLGFVKRAIAAIRNWLRANIPYFKNLELSDADIIEGYLIPARNFVLRGHGEQSVGEMVGAFIRANRKPSRDMGDTMVTAALEYLSRDPEFFQRPSTDSKDIYQIAKDLDPGYRVERMGASSMKSKHKGATRAWEVFVPGSTVRSGEIYTDGNDVWIDVSRLQSGKDSGSAIYDIAASFAHNTGKVMAADPLGLSRLAYYRRNENMLSSALKYGTTKHLRPSTYQTDPTDHYIGHEAEWAKSVRPLKWVEGDDVNNIKELVYNSYDAAIKNMPEIKDVIYDPATEQFQYIDGRPFTDKDSKRIAAELSGSSHPYRAGSATQKRAAIFNTFLRQSGRERGREVLGALVDQLHGRGLSPSLRGVMYSRSQDSENTESVTDTLAFKVWFGDSKVVDADGKPLVVYHGTKSDIASLEPMSGKGSRKLKAIYFSENPNVAASYATFQGDSGANVIPAYVSLVNPIIFRGSEGYVQMGKYERSEVDIGSHDGIIRYDDKGKMVEVVAFSAAQVKSATGNNGDFDPTNPDIRFSRNVTAQQRLMPSWNAPETSKMDSALYALQDKNIDLRRVTQAIKRTGSEIEDRLDAYLQEELFHGRTAKRTQEFLKQELEPLIEEMRMRGVAMADFEEYLWMRHAEERNAQIAKINPDMHDGGSGKTNQEARGYLASLSQADKKKYEALARRIDAITGNTRKTLIDYGIESADTIAAWDSAYQNYVPLMREDMDHGFGNGTGQGYSVKGSSSKRATGSGLPVVDIIANIAQQREKAIIRGEKNRVATALIGLATLNPNQDVWQVNTIPTIKTVNERTNQVEERPDPNYKNRDNVLVARVVDKFGNVVERAIVFNEFDERAMRMAASLKNLDVDQLGLVAGLFAPVTRYISSVNTQYNPIFGMINITRDVQGAALNLESTALKGKQKEVLADTLPALRGIYKEIRARRDDQTLDTEWSLLFEEFEREGGKTGYRDMYRNAQERANAIEHALDPAWWQSKPWGKVLTAGGALAAPEQWLVSKPGKALFAWLSDYNDSLENAVRLAAYKQAKDMGMTKQQAASVAKNLTVNFNRKGAWGRNMGAFYAFFNASVQGTARIAETVIKRNPDGSFGLTRAGKAIVYGGMLLGAMQALALAAAGYDDDEPPEFIRDRNIIIPLDFFGMKKKYVTIPMPLGYNAIPATGRILTEWALDGFSETPQRVSHLLEVYLDMFNPIGYSGLSMQTLTPSALDPLAALTENKDWTGRPIAQEDFSSLDPTPGYTRARDTASTIAKGISYGLNAMSGGTEFTPGVFSPTPDQIDFLIGQVTGGVGREALKVEQTARSIVTGESLPIYKIPVVGRFYGNAESTAAQRTAFYNNLALMNKHKREIEGRIENGEDIDAYIDNHPEAVLFKDGNKFYRSLSKIRRTRDTLRKEGASRDDIAEIDGIMTELMADFNQQVKDLKTSAETTQPE